MLLWSLWLGINPTPMALNMILEDEDHSYTKSMFCAETEQSTMWAADSDKTDIRPIHCFLAHGGMLRWDLPEN